MRDILLEAALFLGESNLPTCTSIQETLTNIMQKLESEDVVIDDNCIDTDVPSLYIKLSDGITIKFSEPDTMLDPWDDPEIVQVSVYYTSNLSYPDDTDFVKWYEIDKNFLENKYTE